MNPVQKATHHIAEALVHLRAAKKNLLRARSDQHVSLAMQIAALEEIHEILTDPECTPEIAEGGEQHHDRGGVEHENRCAKPVG